MIGARTSTDTYVKAVLSYIYTHNDFRIHFSSPNLAKFGLELTAQAVVRAGAEKMLRYSAHPRACKPSRPIVQQHCQFKEACSTYKQAGDSFPCLRGRPATVRARHFMPAVYRPQDGRRHKRGAKRRHHYLSREKRRPPGGHLTSRFQPRKSGQWQPHRSLTTGAISVPVTCHSSRKWRPESVAACCASSCTRDFSQTSLPSKRQ